VGDAALVPACSRPLTRALWLAAVVLGSGCATIDVPVTNENYGSAPTSTQRRARSERAIDSVRRGEDPCSERSAGDDRPAIESVVHGDAPASDGVESASGDGCTMWGALHLMHVSVRGARAYQPGLGGDREIASIDRDGTILQTGLLGNTEWGELRCGKLVTTDLTGDDHIAARVEPDAVVTSGVFGHRYARPAACSDAQAALATAGLMIMEEEAAAQSRADDEKHRREQQQRDLDGQRSRRLDDAPLGRRKLGP
jgi:hypothetical protein